MPSVYCFGLRIPCYNLVLGSCWGVTGVVVDAGTGSGADGVDDPAGSNSVVVPATADPCGGARGEVGEAAARPGAEDPMGAVVISPYSCVATASGA